MFDSIAKARQALDSRSISSRELTEHFLKRIEKINPTLNAFISVTQDKALATASLADQAIAHGEQKNLTGIPIAHKDIFCTEGVRTTCGSKMLDNFIPPYTATCIQSMAEQHAVVLGKTNLDEFAMGSSNETSFYGPCLNPWDVSRVPGGSSGGSAAAVTAQLCLGATGTDTGGSIRQPAALCGITGLKPTYGLVSRYGLIAYASSLDQGGPMARSVEDVAFLLEDMAGYDAKDSTSLNQAAISYVDALKTPLDKKITLGIPKDWFLQLEPQIAQSLEQALSVYRSMGCEIKEVSMPHTQYGVACYYVIAPCECSSNLSRYDGVRYGHRAANIKDLDHLYVRSRAEGFGHEVQKRILVGTYALSSGYYDAYYIKAQKVRRLIAQDYHNAFDQVDMMFAPVTPQSAPCLGEMKADPNMAYQADVFTLGVNLAGLPSLAMPAAMVNQLPMGFQLIGPKLSEQRLLRLGHQFQQITDYHLQTPGDFKEHMA